MILVISNWKKKMLYLICVAFVIIAIALLFSSEEQQAASTPSLEEQPAGSDLDLGTEKVIKNEDQQCTEDSLQEVEEKETQSNVNCDEPKIEDNPQEESESHLEEEKEEGWLKSLIEKFKTEK